MDGNALKHTVILWMVLLLALTVQSQDSVPVQQLQEVEVAGDRMWIGNDRTVFIPTRRQKALANSPGTLIQAMRLPMLREKDGAITGRSGEPVAIFINGHPANEIDIKNFWPKDARRVEYLENPTDPQFEGYTQVVNFVMAEYDYGGVAKLAPFVRVPGGGRCDVSSKINRKRMTFGVMFNSYYERDHRSTQKGEDVYNDIWFNEEHYDKIIRNLNESDYTRADELSGTLSAVYSSPSLYCSHTLSLGWSRNPGSGGANTGWWTPSLFDSDSQTWQSTDRSITPQLKGRYGIRINARWHTNIIWRYAYGHIHNASWNQTATLPPIINSNVEDVHSLSITHAITGKINDRWRLRVPMSANLYWFDTKYSGTASTRLRQTRQDLSGSVEPTWTPSDALRVRFSAGARASLWRILGTNHHDIQPTIEASANWNISQGLSLGARIQHTMTPVEPSQTSPVLIQESELVWLTGNDDLKSSSGAQADIYATWLGSGIFNIDVNTSWGQTRNPLLYTYNAADPALGGIVKHYFNGGTATWLQGLASFNVTLLNGLLDVSLSPKWHYHHYSKPYSSTYQRFSWSGDIHSSWGNCRLRLWYEGSYKGLDCGGMERHYSQDSWNIGFTWGNGTVYADVRIEDIFHNKHKEWSCYTSAHFSQNVDLWRTGRILKISASYTFGFGRRLQDPSILLEGPSEVKSSVVK